MEIDRIQTYLVRDDETGAMFKVEAYSPLGVREKYAGMEITIWNDSNKRIWNVRDGAIRLVSDPDRKV